MHRVAWAMAARAELAAIWNAAPTSDDQLLIWAAADLVYQLERDPGNVGESRHGNVRITVSWPLAVWYEVTSSDEVLIYHIWRYGR
jgi:hypothetical protein